LWLACVCAPALAQSAANDPKADAAAYAATDSITIDFSTCFEGCAATRTVFTRLGLVSRIPSPGPSHGIVQTGTITPQAFMNLVAQAQAIHFFAIPELISADPKYCPAPVSGGETVTVTLFAPGRSHRVVDPHSCQWSPAALWEFERALSSAATVVRAPPH
jgi:hypothetical protein